MKKRLAIAVAAAGLGLGVAAVAPGTASAGNGYCAKAGTSTLRELGLLQTAAQKDLDYQTLNPAYPPVGTPFGQIVKAHTQTPEAFPWCS